MIAFRLACLHIAFSMCVSSFFSSLSFYGHLLQQQDCETADMKGETEGRRSICYHHYEIMIAQPLVISSGWTLISSLIHVHLIWMDDWLYLSCIIKTNFLLSLPTLHLPSHFHQNTL